VSDEGFKGQTAFRGYSLLYVNFCLVGNEKESKRLTWSVWNARRVVANHVNIEAIEGPAKG
jgi:hypothetical protein